MPLWSCLLCCIHTNLFPTKHGTHACTFAHTQLSTLPHTHTYPILLLILHNTWQHTYTHMHTSWSPSPSAVTPPSPPLWFPALNLSWAPVAGSRWHRQPTLIFYWTLFVLFILLHRCATSRGLTHSFQCEIIPYAVLLYVRNANLLEKKWNSFLWILFY